MTKAPAITLATFVRPNPAKPSVEIEGEVVLMSIDDGLYFGLNAVGSEVWRRLGDGVTVAALCTGLTEHYDGDPARIEADTLALLDKLAARALVEFRA